MTTPPNRSTDDAADLRAAPSHTDTPTDDNPNAALRRRLRTLLLFLVVFAALVVLHLTLLDLPYYWDEAGYFIPAARDIYRDGSFVPHSTLSNAHPPLVMAYLALAWKLFGFRIAVARVAMLAVSALALAGLFRLAERVQNARVAFATVVCTAVYPVFFAQSSLAHLDMMVAALTLWALVLYLPPRGGETPLPGAATPLHDDATPLQGVNMPLRGDATPLRDDATALRDDAMPLQGDVMALRRRVACVALLALAAVAKETALLVPLTLCAWELVCRFARGWERGGALVCVERRRRSAWWSLSLLLACVPLALWFAYHRAQTGYTFGNPEYFRYNVESTLSLSRIAEAGWGRLKHVTFHMNLWALTLAGAAAMLLRPRRDGARERERIAPPVQIVFLVLVLAHVVALSIVGGAVLARYMLPVLPLVILLWVSTLWRRVPAWPLAVALVCAAFAYRCEVNPSYSFPWEENLAYRDFVVLHRDAARFLSENYAGARVLTSWPATDELRNPYYGYTPHALSVVPVESLKREELERVAAQRAQYDVALLYSTHGGLSLEEAARVLGARVVFREERKGQWVAVVEAGGGR
jgi:4-amino-4-deoxy-L-arabinose transferase-like glycosyltransferase